MIVREAATIAFLVIGLYWVVSPWFTDEQCYVQTNESPYVAKWMSCESIPKEWTVLEVKE